MDLGVKLGGGFERVRMVHKAARPIRNGQAQSGDFWVLENGLFKGDLSAVRWFCASKSVVPVDNSFRT